MSLTAKIFLYSPDDAAKEGLEKFFEDAGVTVEWAGSADEAPVSIDWPSEGKMECEPGKLHVGGRTTCPIAFANASKTNINRSVMGELMNHLDIRVFACQLGCFK